MGQAFLHQIRTSSTQQNGGMTPFRAQLFGCAMLGLSLALPLQSAGATQPAINLPVAQNGGYWKSGHVQGIAVDQAGGYIYYSFTNLIAKYDFQGKLIGTLEGWTGHLGDLDFNVNDGKIYGSLEYKKDRAFYVAVIDGAQINRVGIAATQGDVFRTVYLPEVAADYAADLNGDGKFDGDIAATPDHRYGTSGIDGVSFGPQFGRSDGEQLLTVAYGVYSNLERTDNDHQILLQYDIANWAQYARPLVEAEPHRVGPAQVHGKYFMRTGNTSFGVQTLAYSADQQRWYLAVYQGRKPSFPNYLMFAVDAATQPQEADLIGVPAANGQGWEQGKLLALADDGLTDSETGIRGWNANGSVGFQPVGHSLFYMVENLVRDGLQTANLKLVRWTADPETPFADVNDDK